MSKSCYIGVDVSKDKLDICELTNKENQKPKYSSIPNKPEFINIYFEKIINSDVVVVFEATSNYHLNLQICLNSLKIRYSVLNPNKSSLFLKHLNTIKTDMTDSYGLAVYCKTFKSSILPSKYNKEYVLIKAYNSSYDLLSKMQSQLKNLIHSQNFIQDEDLKQTLINLQSAIELTKDKLQKLAIDLFIFKDGKIITDKSALQHIGNYWESLNPLNRWGGNFKSFLDTPHFERHI